MLDQIRRDLQTRLEDLLGEIDRLRRALAALTSRERGPDRGDHAAPVSGSAPAGESAAESAGASARRTPAEKPTGAAAVPARSRTAQGATKVAVLAALGNGSAMTAGEIASATGLGRATVGTTLSKLATSGEIAKAARGYQIAGVEPAQRFYFRTEDDAGPGAVVANLPELEAAIAVCEPGVLRHHCAEHDFSRWVAGVFHNEPLAAEIAAVEAQLSVDRPTETVEHVRPALIAALQARHTTQR